MKQEYILTTAVAEKKLRRMTLEIVERNYNETELILIGIKDSGVVIANKIALYLTENFKGAISVLELTMDKKIPNEIRLNKNIDFNDKVVVLIDDVANSGKTMLYALKPLLAQHPKKIQTLALVERTHKIFPIDVDYVGLSVSTTLNEHIFVELKDNEILGARMQQI